MMCRREWKGVWKAPEMPWSSAAAHAVLDAKFDKLIAAAPNDDQRKQLHRAWVEYTTDINDDPGLMTTIIPRLNRLLEKYEKENTK